MMKKHAKSETPVQRLLAHPAINSQQKTALKNIYNNLNPFVLRSTIQKKLNAIFKRVRLRISEHRDRLFQHCDRSL